MYLFIDIFMPILLTILLVFPQVYFATNGKRLLSLLLPVAFSTVIYLFFRTADFRVYMILGNFMFYLMWIATLATYSKYIPMEKRLNKQNAQ